jgi:mRNA interferase MazF
MPFPTRGGNQARGNLDSRWRRSPADRYTGKPHPVVIVQDDRFDGTASVTICAFTSDPTEAPLSHLAVTPTAPS